MVPREIEQRVRGMVAEAYGVDEALLTLETDFGLDLDDSMQLVEVIIGCEEAFGVKVPDQDVAAIRTVGTLVEYLKRHLSAGEP
jgi:acyl carrier protein